MKSYCLLSADIKPQLLFSYMQYYIRHYNKLKKNRYYIISQHDVEDDSGVAYYSSYHSKVLICMFVCFNALLETHKLENNKHEIFVNNF